MSRIEDVTAEIERLKAGCWEPRLAEENLIRAVLCVAEALVEQNATLMYIKRNLRNGNDRS